MCIYENIITVKISRFIYRVHLILKGYSSSLLSFLSEKCSQLDCLSLLISLLLFFSLLLLIVRGLATANLSIDQSALHLK